jgi:hypothetical protein
MVPAGFAASIVDILDSICPAQIAISLFMKQQKISFKTECRLRRVRLCGERNDGIWRSVAAARSSDVVR